MIARSIRLILSFLFLLSASTIPLRAIDRVSVAPGNVQLNDDSYVDDITPDGRFVVITSKASNLVPGDTNGNRDMFVIDRDDGSVERVTVDSDENQVTDITGFTSLRGSISDDGNLVCFATDSSQLVTGDTNGATDVFIRDRSAGTTTRVSLTDADGEIATGAYGPILSADGSTVVFIAVDDGVVAADMNGMTDVFVRELGMGGTTRIVSVSDEEMPGDGESGEDYSISADGNLVAFSSDSTNLVTGDMNMASDVFLRDIAAGSTTRVSLTSTGAELDAAAYGGSMSSDGTKVVFNTAATNVLPGDTNGFNDVFIRNLTNNTVKLASGKGGGSSFITDNGISGGAISPDGRFVRFSSYTQQIFSPHVARYLFTTYIHDSQTSTTIPADLPATGFASRNGDPKAVETVSVAFADNGFFAFHSNADNLVTGDTNASFDVFTNTYKARPDNSALKAALAKKIKKLKKLAKKAKKKGQKAKAKKLLKKAKKLIVRLRAL